MEFWVQDPIPLHCAIGRSISLTTSIEVSKVEVGIGLTESGVDV
jgi:hypothetical protein